MPMGCLAYAYEQALVAQGAGKMRRHRWRCRGQMAVECAFVFPVVAVIAFIVANALVFVRLSTRLCVRRFACRSMTGGKTREPLKSGRAS